MSCSKYSQSATSMRERLKTIFKKAKELSILCEVEVCVLHYGPDGELETWPKEREKVEDIARRYIQLDKSQRLRKSVTLYAFLKRKKKKTKNPVLSDPDQISQLISSFQNKLTRLQERLGFVEENKKTNLDHHNSTTPSSSLTHQQQPLNNPSGQFSLFMYNHGDSTLSKIPLPPSSNFTNYSETGFFNNQKSNFQQHPCTVSNTQDYGNHSLYGCDHNFQQQPYVSNTQDYSGLQDSINNYGLNQLMQQEPNFYGFDHNMFTNSNVVDPNTAFQNPYGYNMVGNNTSFSQDFPYLSSSCLLETSPLPPFP